MLGHSRYRGERFVGHPDESQLDMRLRLHKVLALKDTIVTLIQVHGS